jgi:predicted negative regulator of RcsB-dependent stress response
MPTSDKEQIQMLKDWWKQYGNYILSVIIIFFVVSFGWRYWQQHKYQRLERTSVTYVQMLTAFEQQKNDEVKLFAKQLMQNYPRSSYASLAALMLAKIAVQAKDFKLAQEQLEFVIKKSPNATLRQIARIRAARILLSTKQPQAALDLLAKVDDEAYMAAVSEISGDVLLELGKVNEAKQAYQKAKNKEVKGAASPLLQLKMQQF